MSNKDSAFTSLSTEDLSAFLDGVPRAIARLAMEVAQERADGNEFEAREYEQTIQIVRDMEQAIEFEIMRRGESE
ncbi:MAG: hypothetical protein AAFN11_03700 [Chloroflexota bacterium]